MNVRIHAHQLDIGDSLRSYAERHIADTLNHIFQRKTASLDIEFSKDVGGREKVCKVTVVVPRSKTLVASAQDENPYAAVDLVAEKISRELRQIKDRQLSASRQGSEDDEDVDFTSGHLVDEEAFEEVVRPRSMTHNVY